MTKALAALTNDPILQAFLGHDPDGTAEPALPVAPEPRGPVGERVVRIEDDHCDGWAREGDAVLVEPVERLTVDARYVLSVNGYPKVMICSIKPFRDEKTVVARYPNELYSAEEFSLEFANSIVLGRVRGLVARV